MVLKRVLDYCRDVVMSRNAGIVSCVAPPLMVIHGGAGTGKSTLINNISLWVQKLLTKAGDDTDCPYLLRLAPTGMAASNIEGQTLHTALKFKFGNKYESLSDKTRDALRDSCQNVQVIIIDEFSMMKSDQLYHLHLRLQEIKQNDKVFGGVSVLLLGDLMQLKPIYGDYIFQPPRNKNLRDVHVIFQLWEHFDVYVLEQNHRQGEDKVYAEVLNRIRFKGKEDDMSEEDMALLKSRIKKPDNSENTSQIYGYNKTVNAVNEGRLNQINSQLYTMEATHTPSKKNIKVKPSGTIEETAFLQTLRLKVGARVMLIHNINTEDGLTNGAQGEVVEVVLRNNNVRYVLIKFDNSNIGKEHRRKFRFLPAVVRCNDVIPIEKFNLSYTLGDVRKDHAARASLTQFPLKLSWASSAHKSQGQTFHPPMAVWTDLNECFQAAMAYVILSRVTAITQMFLKEFDLRKIYCSSLAKDEAERLRSRAVNFEHTEWSHPKEGVVRISSINARSLQQHSQDLRVDEFIMNSDIICIQETWLEADLQDPVNQFQHFYVHERSKGIALLTRLTPAKTQNFQSDHCSLLKASYEDFDVVNFYRFASSSNIQQFTDEVLHLLDLTRTQLVIGDANINLLKSPRNTLTQSLEQRGFQQLAVRPSHNLGGCLDHIYFFSPSRNMSCKLFCSRSVFWSDHSCQSVLLETLRVPVQTHSDHDQS